MAGTHSFACRISMIAIAAGAFSLFSAHRASGAGAKKAESAIPTLASISETKGTNSSLSASSVPNAVFGFAALLGGLEKHGDLARLPLSKKNRETLADEIRAKRFNFERPAIEQPSDTRLDLKFKDSTLSMDFRELEKSVVYVNAKKIELASTKSYFIYRTELSKIVSSKTSVYNVIVGDFAYAQDKSVADMGAAVLASLGEWISSTKTWAIGTPEDAIKKFYDAKALRAHESNSIATDGYSEVSNEESNFDAPVFVCTNRKLASVTNVIHVLNGKMVSLRGLSLTADSAGSITKSKSVTLSNFAKLAHACCEKPGCEKSAKAHLTDITTDFVEPSAPEKASTGARSDR